MMIDSGATSNFINKQQANGYGFLLRKKMELYALYILDRSAIKSNKRRVTFETKILIIKMLKKHIENIQFNIITIGIHIVVFGASWLQLYNLQIDWWKECIIMSQCRCGSNHRALLES